tara:strand:- start:115 stop:1293 length:1179 start_codon:yes stop_codon:yes gene_type:complete
MVDEKEVEIAPHGEQLLPDLSVIDELLDREGIHDLRAKEFVSQLEEKVGKEYRLKTIECFRIINKNTLQFLHDDDERCRQWDCIDEAEEIRLSLDSPDEHEVKLWERFEGRHSAAGLGQKIATIRKQYSFKRDRDMFVKRYARNEQEFVDDAARAQSELFDRWRKSELEYNEYLDSPFGGIEPKRFEWPVGSHGPQIRESKDYDLIQLLLRYFSPRYSIAFVKAEVLNKRETWGRPRAPLTNRVNKKQETIPPINPSTTVREAIQGMHQSSWRVDVVFNEGLTRPIGVINQNSLAEVILAKGRDALEMPIGELTEWKDWISPPVLDMHDSIDTVASLLGRHHEAVVFKWEPDEYARTDEITSISEAIQPGWHIITHLDVVYYLSNIRYSVES